MATAVIAQNLEDLPPAHVHRALVPKFTAPYFDGNLCVIGGYFWCLLYQSAKKCAASSAKTLPKPLKAVMSLPLTAPTTAYKIGANHSPAGNLYGGCLYHWCELGEFTFIKPSGGFWWWQSACRLTADCKGMGWRDATWKLPCVSTVTEFSPATYHPSPKPKEPCYDKRKINRKAPLVDGYEVVISIEIHCQQYQYQNFLIGFHPIWARPNTQTNIVDLAMPGALPVLNKMW